MVQPIHPAGLDALREAGVEPVVSPASDMATVSAHVGDCEAVITRDAGFSAAALAAAPNLRVVSVHGTGVNSVDIPACTARGVLVCNTPGANAQSVVELTLGLSIAAARGIPAADRYERAGERGFREAGGFSELSCKTALIVGWGNIGARVGRALNVALGMEILIHSPVCDDGFGFERVLDFHAALSRADLVSLHAPLTSETRHMISARSLSHIKRGAILVNTARAGLVDEAALAEALGEGRVAAAALDVYSEGAPHGPLASFNRRVIFTPHLGGSTEEALRRAALAAVANTLAACAGTVPASTLNPQSRGAAS